MPGEGVHYNRYISGTFSAPLPRNLFRYHLCRMIAVLFLVMVQSRRTFHNKNPRFSDITQKFNTKNSRFCSVTSDIKKASA